MAASRPRILYHEGRPSPGQEPEAWRANPGKVVLVMGRWRVVALLALLSLVLAGVPRSAVAESGVVSANGDRLARPGGGSLFLLGVNYVGAPDRSWTMWEDAKFDPGLIDRDFGRAQAAGLNTIRIFIRPPLPQQLLAGQWGKLDTVVGLAERRGLYLIVTLYDYREDDLSKAANLAGAIARRYADRSTILAYDFKNEPHYQDLAIAIYPGSPPPLQSDTLIKQYGELVTPAAAAAWRQNGDGKTVIPARFSAQEAYLYANNYRYWQSFLADAGNWVTARNYLVSTVDYINSPDSAKWRPLLDVLDQTLAAWLSPQVAALRGGDQRRLTTVGYSDAVLARLSANKVLGFLSFHRFPSVSAASLRVASDMSADLHRSFPSQPAVLEEFGFSNAEVDPVQGAIYETALLLHVLSQGMAGGAKWSLYDVADGYSARENNFGLYRVDGSAKPMVDALRALSGYAAASALLPGNFTVEADQPTPSLRYVYAAPDALFVAGRAYADPAGRLAFDAPAATQVFASWATGNRIDIATTAPVTLRLNPAKLAGLPSVRDLSLQTAEGTAVVYQQQGESVIFPAAAGQQYWLTFAPRAVDARIEIVWPHDGLPVDQATKANIGAYLFQVGQNATVCPGFGSTVRLYRALNNGVEEPVAVGAPRTAAVGGLSFPAWDFNDVDVAAARDPRNKYYFRLAVDGYQAHSSIWSHGADARTYFPQQDVPSGVATAVPAAVDAKIEIVWPHDGLPVDKATKANIGATIFVRGSSQTVPADWWPSVRLWRTVNNGFEEMVAVGQKVIKREGGLAYPVWEFNDVDVSAARDPRNKIYFRVAVDGVDSRANVWSHGADARTYFPQQDVPAAVGACN